VRFSYRRSLQDEETVQVDVVPLEGQDGCYRVTVGTQVFELSASLLQRVAFLKEAGVITVQYEGKEYRLYDATQRRHPSARGGGDLHAPMAGKIIRVFVQPGEQVQAGAILVIIEAMKMEQQIVAPRDGVVSRVLCREGEQVTAGMELVVLVPAAE
jgi:3-methylcrotonyl-CoA carboxylase alpha subunit